VVELSPTNLSPVYSDTIQFNSTQLDVELSGVELSCVAINGALDLLLLFFTLGRCSRGRKQLF